MLSFLNPPSAPPPFSRYSQMVSAPANYRWLHISGQVGADRQHKTAQGFEAQADLAWSNLVACLEADGMTVQDLVKVNVMLTRASDVPASRVARDKALNGAQPASTLIIVAGLANPEWLIEIEGIAAKAA
ncbi:RidA family protein [Dongia rigui]|uniref:RidA family protein n=1 Tax=Dongia rigui TaxID=940149 RepID=A0ABU5E0N0_9PROT|nr:RidA family protein [Dongia rigui]MDY0873143.1 RidA family protein [Dongia rigui]